MKQKSANKYVWVSYWLYRFSPDHEEADITANVREDNKWECEIQLPLVEKTVKSVSTTEVNAMYNASEKAALLIDDYLKSHPEIYVRNTYKRKHYIFVEDEKGRFESARLSPEYRKKEGEKMTKMMMDSFKAVETAITKVNKINGMNKGLVIQVMDKCIFGDDLDEESISLKISQSLKKSYGIDIFGIGWTVVDNYVIGIAYQCQEV